MHIKSNAKFVHQRKDAISPDRWQRAQNTDACLTENRVPSKSCASSARPKSRLVHKAKAASSSQKVHPYKSRMFKATGPLRLQDLHSVFASAIQFNSTLAQADDCSPLIQSTPTTNSEHWGGLDCVSRYSPRSFLAASKGFTVHSRRPHSR